MKALTYYAIGLLTMVTAGCSSMSQNHAFDHLSQLQPGMSRSAIYAALGQPAVETERQVQWDVQSGKDSWQVVLVSFNDSGTATAITSHGEQK